MKFFSSSVTPRPFRSAVIAAALTAVFGGFAASPVLAETRGIYRVIGVEKEEMLKMRAGPGTGYRIIVGLPKGAELYLFSCEQTGSTRWCKVALQEARGLKGYVSRAYLQEK